MKNKGVPDMAWQDDFEDAVKNLVDIARNAPGEARWELNIEYETSEKDDDLGFLVREYTGWRTITFRYMKRPRLGHQEMPLLDTAKRDDG